MATSNRIGHPVRARKRNRLIFNENEETSFGPTRFNYGSNSLSSSNKPWQNVQIKQEESSSSCVVIHKGKINKITGNNLANSLKTLLKLPKANNWVNHEWFYGTIDQVLFLDDNEFCFCLKDSFPNLKTRFLTRAEWSQIRRLLGKPRRCSSSFFEEERATLNSKRNKIRFLQQNKVSDLTNYKDLPEYIPQTLVVGNQVTALARSYEGLYFGVIEGIEPLSGTYRVSFNRSDVGSLSIPDYEVAPSDPPILVPLSSFQIKTRKIWHVNKSLSIQDNSNNIQTPPATEKIIVQRKKGEFVDDHNVGGFPVTFLSYLVKICKLLNSKEKKIKELKAMNSKIEKMSGKSEKIPFSFKRKFAEHLVDMETTNQELEHYLKLLQSHSLKVGADGKLKSLKPDGLVQKYHNESQRLVESLYGKFKVGEKSTNLIIGLMSLLLHLRGFQDNEVSSHEFESLFKTLSNIRAMIHQKNHGKFQDNAEIHVRHIIGCVSRLGNVGEAFAEPNDLS